MHRGPRLGLGGEEQGGSGAGSRAGRCGGKRAGAGARRRPARMLEKRRVYVMWGGGAGWGSSRVVHPGNPSTEMGWRGRRCLWVMRTLRKGPGGVRTRCPPTSTSPRDPSPIFPVMDGDAETLHWGPSSEPHGTPGVVAGATSPLRHRGPPAPPPHPVPTLGTTGPSRTSLDEDPRGPGFVLAGVPQVPLRFLRGPGAEQGERQPGLGGGTTVAAPPCWWQWPWAPVTPFFPPPPLTPENPSLPPR